ncbi:MAG: hypothetical protein LUQ28_15885 [Methylococcaceae bacterium]|nr:hypothetical protein [Methylococcaceae bacterium]
MTPAAGSGKKLDHEQGTEMALEDDVIEQWLEAARKHFNQGDENGD